MSAIFFIANISNEYWNIFAIGTNHNCDFEVLNLLLKIDKGYNIRYVQNFLTS